MSEVKHTPGPWSAQHPRGEYDDAATGQVICEVERLFGASITVRAASLPMRSTDQHEAENSANAHLIAAAPDLLTACKAIMNAETQKQHELAVREVEKAITKAEGRS